MNIQEAYSELRRPRFSPYNNRTMYVQTAASALMGARQAVTAARIDAQWKALGGETIDRYEASKFLDWDESPRVRIVAEPDDCQSLDDLLGDTYSAKCNPEIKQEILERERQAEIDRINQDGVWFMVAEYWDGNEWEHADSIGGFIGRDFAGSGYDTDLKAEAMRALDDCLTNEARELEATRPDLYR